MKRFVIYFILSIISIGYSYSMQVDSIKEQLTGIWLDENVSYSFINDSLYIDETNNEGFCYSYKINTENNNSYITIYCGDIFDMKLQIEFISDVRIRFKIIDSYFINEIDKNDLEFTLYKDY